MEAITAPALDGWLDDLARNLSAWQNTGLEKRLAYLRLLRKDCYRLAARWAEVCCQIKGVDPKSQLAGEEWAMGPVIMLRNLRLLERQLQTPPRSGRVVRSLPEDKWDLIQWPILRAETWSQSTAPVTELPVHGKVGLVLGAGNVSSISATDVLHKMFVENQVILLKMNPVHEPLGPVLEEVFNCLIQDGFLRIVSGGAAEGSLACQHPKIEALHVTGSQHTYQAIRKVAPNKPISAELGCVSPVLVAPGRWSNRQLAYQARHVAAMLTTNAGFNCNAAQVLITSRQWPQRDSFLTEVRRALSKVPSRPAYYPGALDRHAEILRQNPQAEQLGPPAPGAVCWTLVPGLDPEQDHPGFRNEAFCGVLYEVSLDVPYAEFLIQAAEFANQKLWGNLSCSILISPEGQRTQPWRRAVEILRYGAVGVNIWPGLVFALVNLPWGAYPGNTPDDIQSGVGFVHNTAHVANPEKAVLYGPFYTPIRMVWQSGFNRFRGLAQALVDFEYQPGFKNALKAHWQALRGGVGM